MRAVALLTLNFLREQRWVLLALAVYGGGMGAVLAFSSEQPNREDLFFYARQQGALGLLFGVFLVSSAIHNDRRSRRLLLIFSKAVARWQYLIALALGAACVSTGFILLAWAGLLGISSRWAIALDVSLRSLLLFVPLALLANTIGLCFATFAHPFFANVLTLSVLGSSFAIAPLVHGYSVFLLPGANLLLPTLVGRSTREASLGIFVVALQIGLTFALACWTYSRRDLGINVE